MRRAAVRGVKVAVAELAGDGNNGGSHGPVFVRALGPDEVGAGVDPEGESHDDQNTGTIRSMPTEKELLDRIRYLEEQNSALQDKLDMIYAILAPDYEEPMEEEAFVQIEGQRKKPD